MELLATEAVYGAATFLRISLILVAGGGALLCAVDGVELIARRAPATIVRFSGDLFVAFGAALTSFALEPGQSFASKYVPIIITAVAVSAASGYVTVMAPRALRASRDSPTR